MPEDFSHDWEWASEEEAHSHRVEGFHREWVEWEGEAVHRFCERETHDQTDDWKVI